MKIAVIVVDNHHAGKSKTINKYLKPKLNITEDKHKFTHNGKEGVILSQSLEEAKKDVNDVIKKYRFYDFLILSSRPTHEIPSSLNKLKVILYENGYQISEVVVDSTDSENYYDSKADEILGHLAPANKDNGVDSLMVAFFRKPL